MAEARVRRCCAGTREVGRLSEIEGVSPEEFASGLRAFEEALLALLELASADAAGMCTMMRLVSRVRNTR